jgi:thiol:disulfide interchange protein
MQLMTKTRVGVLAAACLALAAHAADPIYPDIARASADIDMALKTAKQDGKRVIVDFGGNWCGDCKVLDINFRKPENAALLKDRFVLVHVNVGDKGIDSNLDVGERYGIALKKGVPALAVLESDGRIVYAQKNGEFESMRKMDPQLVNDFLTTWQGAPK